jgi:molybdopterin-guanine dinucleotide biosynthesis protein A
MNIAGVIIAGGRSARMGGREKSFLPLAGQPMLAHVIARLRPQVDGLAINANGDPARFASFGVPVTADRLETETPLAGLEAAFAWAVEQNAEWLLTVPCDTPLLPHDLAHRLMLHAPSVAASAGQTHYLTGLWPASLHGTLRMAIEQRGMRAVKHWAAHCQATEVAWDALPQDPFRNINTPQDLAEVAAALEQHHE